MTNTVTDIKVGDRVKYIHNDTPEDKASGYYPEVGTLGTVLAIACESIEVLWDEGVKYDDSWYCKVSQVEVAQHESASCEVLEKALELAVNSYNLHAPLRVARDKEFWKEKARKLLNGGNNEHS